MPSMNPWAFEWEKNMKNADKVKRVYTCRAVYDSPFGKLKCQGKGKHKGIHSHTLAQPGAVITITWHPIVSGNVVPRTMKRSPERVMKALELESFDDMGLGLAVMG